MTLGLTFENISKIHHVLSHRQQKIKTLKIKDKPAAYIKKSLLSTYFNGLCLFLAVLHFSLPCLGTQPLKCFKSPRFPTKAGRSCARLHKLRIKPTLISEKDLVWSASCCSRTLKGPDDALKYCLCTSGNSRTTPVRNQKRVLFTPPQHQWKHVGV